jgi:hypothetical protein
VSELSEGESVDTASRTGSRWFGARVQVWLSLILALITAYLTARTVDFRQLMVALQETRR